MRQRLTEQADADETNRIAIGHATTSIPSLATRSAVIPSSRATPHSAMLRTSSARK